MQEMILNYEENLNQDEYSSQVTFMTQRKFMRNKLDTSITFFYNINYESLKAKPEIIYNYSNNLNLNIGADYMLKEGNSLSTGLTEDVIYIQSEYIF